MHAIITIESDGMRCYSRQRRAAGALHAYIVRIYDVYTLGRLHNDVVMLLICFGWVDTRPQLQQPLAGATFDVHIRPIWSTPGRSAI